MCKIDPYTGNSFMPKRSNQKFETRENQIAFNNEKARVKRHEKKKVDSTLDSNRNVLMKVLGNKEEAAVSKDFLLGAGFNFTFFSQSVMYKNQSYQLVYEYGILQDKDNNLFVIKKFEL